MNVNDVNTTVEIIDYLNKVLNNFIDESNSEYIFWLLKSNLAMSTLSVSVLMNSLTYL